MGRVFIDGTPEFSVPEVIILFVCFFVNNIFMSSDRSML